MVTERKSPCFEVYSSQIEILSTPEDYYLALNRLILSSEFRINMSALYIGTGNKEKFLIDRLGQKLKNNKDIKVNIVLDYQRSHRIDDKAGSSNILLTNLVLENISHK